MVDLQTNEIKYCTHCGSANKASAVICCECEKEIKTHYKPFYDFLKNHTKDEVTGQVTDTLFSCLKKYLMSHIYGIALSVTIVATAASAVYSAAPHIERVSEPTNTPVVNNTVQVEEQKAEQEPAQEPEEETTPLSENDFQDFEHLSSNYDAFVDSLRSSESYWDISGGLDYNSASEMYAENNIPGFSYGGVHEMISNPISLQDLDNDPRLDALHSVYFTTERYSDLAGAVTGQECTTEIAKKLLADGYRVAECNYILIKYAGETEYNTTTHSGKGLTEKLVYKFVYVEHNGKWYIADDRLIEHIKA